MIFHKPWKNELENLFSVLDFTREDVPISALIDSIISKESNFQSTLLSANEINVYYGTASVLRYSASYWDAVLSDVSSSHPFYNIIVDHLRSLDNDLEEIEVRAWDWKKFWRGVTVVAADAGGFAGGYALGSALSMGVPAVGAAAGTLLGGACSLEVRNMWGGN